MYVHRISTINIKQDENFDVKAACKKEASAYIRRTDRFIQLALLGVSGIVKSGDIEKKTALFMTSGQGNLAVFSRLCYQRYIENVPPKPVDFINSLSNTAGFYIAKYLGLESRNLNLAQQGFVVENALSLAEANLKGGQETQILLGGVDEKPDDESDPYSYLDLPECQNVGEGSNWVLLNNYSQGALAQLTVVSQPFNRQSVIEYVKNQQGITHVSYGHRVSNRMRERLMSEIGIEKFDCFGQYDFYETNALFVLNRYIEEEQGHLVYIDYFKDVYRVILLNHSINFLVI